MIAMARRRSQATPIPGASHRAPGSADATAEAAPIVIATGGTAGHVFPAAALAAVLRARGLRPVVLTDARAAGQDFAGAEWHVIPGAGIADRGPLRALAALGAIASGTIAARRLLAGLRPAAIVGFGGYPSLAPVLAARLLRRRPVILLHEQNAVLGRANRALAPLADAVAVSFASTRHAPPDAVRTGNPVRAAVAALADRGYQPATPGQPARLVVLGGSLGARAFSDLVPAALARSPDLYRLELTQQCRPEDLARVEAAYAAVRIRRAEVAAFFSDMPARMAAAELVIARAGASTVAELVVIGRPSILLPLPGAIDDHQRANARALAAAGAALVLEEPGLTPERLEADITALLNDRPRLSAMATAAGRLGRPGAADLLADLLLTLAARRRGQ